MALKKQSLKGKQNLKLSYLAIEEVKENPNNPRTHSEKHYFKLAKSISIFGYMKPILVDQNYQIIAGNAVYQAAKKLKLSHIPVIFIEHLTKEQIKVYIIADNKLAEGSDWDNDILKIEFENLIEFFPDLDLTVTGFEIPEIDFIIHSKEEKDTSNKPDSGNIIPELKKVPQNVQPGDLWQLGNHRLYCGDALLLTSYEVLLDRLKASMIVMDSPYNVKIKGNVSGRGKIKHQNFNMASGEMSSEEYTDFLRRIFENLVTNSIDGSIHYVFMDWRHSFEVLTASHELYKPLNLCVWDKGNPGMGSFYRSQHELVYVFKSGTAAHINNIELGKYGRFRSNVWNYKGIHAMNRSSLKEQKLHPTVKPVPMLIDAILDASNPNDIILDCFGGSGSTLLAAEKIRRKAYLIEIEPKYCDVILHRYKETFDDEPILLTSTEGGA